MKTLVLNQWEKLRSSLWFVPGLMAFGAVLLAFAVGEVDRRFPTGDSLLWRAFFVGGAGGAGSILSTIAGSMIGVTGVVFSVTIVSLSLASGQFGPRLLRNFMRDTGNQFVLGTFIATFLYCILGLRTVSPASVEGHVPRATVLGAIVLVVASLAVLIYFIHHVATSIQAETVIANVADELDAAIDTLYPEELGEGGTLAEAERGRVPGEPGEGGVQVAARRNGYVQAIDHDALMALAKERDLVVKLLVRPGEFAIEGTAVATAAPREHLDEDVLRRLREAVLQGSRRTNEQDVEFALDQLVEVGARALSPGVNDPFTAMSCIHRLGAALCRLGGRRLPSPYRFDGEGNLRVVARVSTYDGLVDGALNQLRQNSTGSVAVTMRLLETLETVATCTTPGEGRRAVLREHAARIVRGARDAGHDPSDLRELEERYEAVVRALSEPARGEGPPTAGG